MAREPVTKPSGRVAAAAWRHGHAPWFTGDQEAAALLPRRQAAHGEAVKSQFRLQIGYVDKSVPARPKPLCEDFPSGCVLIIARMRHAAAIGFSRFHR